MADELREFLARARGSGATATARVISLDELHRTTNAALEQPWGFDALRGRLVELSARGASATLTIAFDLVLEAQRAAEPVAWIVPWSADATTGTFFPPDAAEAGVDLSSLVVVRAPSTVSAARSAERLLRSGAFGLVVLDYGSTPASSHVALLPTAHQGRLVSLAQVHDAAVVCLTDKNADSGSLGSLVSLRAEALRVRSAEQFQITVRALKDKRTGPGWVRSRKARGPAGS